ncbi:MAG: hypothetical protein HeimC3_21410 [Candidatus Heimdallarchaeota archaeon LC_3]|nr:MAG: hypothetical protein HeimC3_21410 [Candidatus Heimdallarchaeota archaeon LC_3]
MVDIIKTETTTNSARTAFFTMISDSVRHLILEYLLEHSKSSVNNLIEVLNKPQTLISYHLHCLTDCGLLNRTKSDKDGRKMIYSIHEPDFVEKIFQLADSYLLLHKNCETHQACRIKL